MPKKMTKITTSELILSAIFYLQQKNGVTAKEITKYICEKRGCPQKHMKDNVKKALERATIKGIFCRKRGIYRINNDFGLNKILNNKGKGKGRKGSKGAKSKENPSGGKSDFRASSEPEKRNEPMLFYEIVDERMNDAYDNHGFYIELPPSYDLEDDDDEDFNETDDGEDDDADFFSDDMENTQNTQPKAASLHQNVNVNKAQDFGCGARNSFNDPFQNTSRDEFHGDKLLEDRIEKREDREEEEKEEETCDGGNPEARSLQIRENSKESSENSLGTEQSNDGDQFRDEDHHSEEFDDRHHIDMDWDIQPNDLECIDRLLEGKSYPMNLNQQQQAGSDTTLGNKEMKLQDNILKIKTEDQPTDSLETSLGTESTR